jgi:uncharacterized protein (DUF849 family)
MGVTDHPVIVEVRLNELATRARNPHVPWTPDEIAADAHACWEAGASIVHFHVRNPDGSPAHDAELYGRAVEAIRRRCDVLIHPTLAGGQTPDPEERLAPLKYLCSRSATRPNFVPIDMGSTNLDAFDAAQLAYVTEHRVYANSIATLRRFTAYVREQRLMPMLCAWTVPCLRTIGAFMDAGWLDEPALVCIVLTEGGMMGGHPGTLEGLDSMVRFLPRGRDLQWSVCIREGNLLPLAATIIARGGHLSIGTGDYPYSKLGAPTNASLVRLLAQEAASQGRALATVAQARRLLDRTHTGNST